MTTTVQSAATTLREPGVEFEFDEAQLAAVSFLARYSGRTLITGSISGTRSGVVAQVEPGGESNVLVWGECRSMDATAVDHREPGDVRPFVVRLDPNGKSGEIRLRLTATVDGHEYPPIVRSVHVEPPPPVPNIL